MNPYQIHDVVIAGGGPAGLSAALLLGRRIRDVVLCDAGGIEIQAIPSTGGFTGRESGHPSEVLRLGREQLGKFETISHVVARIDHVERSIAGFTIRCEDGRKFDTRSLLIASDLVATLPDVRGAENFHGTTLHQYPYGDGWDHRGHRLGVLGGGASDVDLALKLLTWSDRITLFANGESVSGLSRQRMADKGVAVVLGKVSALFGRDRRLAEVRLDDGSTVPCEALFFSSSAIHHADLSARLGCDVKRMDGNSDWRPDGGTGIQGLFFAGNPLKAVEMAVIAAAEGVRAADAINRWLDQAEQSYLAVRKSA